MSQKTTKKKKNLVNKRVISREAPWTPNKALLCPAAKILDRLLLPTIVVVLFPPLEKNLRWSRTRLWGSWLVTGCHQKAVVSYLRAETGILPLKTPLERHVQQLHASALQPMHPSHRIVSPLPPQGHPLASFYRTLIDLHARGDDLSARPVIFGVVLEKGTYSFAWHLLQGQMIGEIVQSRCYGLSTYQWTQLNNCFPVL